MALPHSIRSRLERLERRFKIDFRYILRGGSFLTLTQIASAIAGLILTVAFANLVPPATYGTYRYVLALYSIFAIAALPGIDTAVLQSVSRGYDKTYRKGMGEKFRWGLLGSLAAFAYAGYQYFYGNAELARALLILGAALPCMESLSLNGAFLNGKRKFGVSAGFDIATQFLSLLSLFCTMLLTHELSYIMLAYFVPYIVGRFVTALYIGRFIHETSEMDPGFSRYGKSMTVFQIVSQLISSLDQIVLFQFMGPAQLAIFALATAVPNRMQSVFRISGTLASPKFATQSARDIARSLPRRMLLFAAAILVLCIGYVIAAPLLFHYVFPKYLPSLTYSQVAVFATLSSITYPFGAYLFTHKKVKENYLIAISSFVAKALCLIVLVPLIGIWGAIAGLLATSLVTIGITLFLLYKTANAPEPNTDI